MLLRDDGDHLRERHGLSWYNSRRRNPRRAPEWRLYYEGATDARAGDLFALMQRQEDGALAVVMAPAGSTWERQLLQILGDTPDESGRFATVELGEVLDLFTAPAAELFELVGWDDEPEITAAAPFADEAVALFGLSFPSSATFSQFVQDRVPVDFEQPDDALLTWWRAEESHF